MDKLKQNGHANLVNKPNGLLQGNWYPQHRPLKIYRKQGKTVDTLDNLDNTYWMFENVLVHIIFGTFWYAGYGYVALRRDPVAFDLGGITYTLRSVDGQNAIWARSDTGLTVTWAAVDGKQLPCEPNPTYVKQYKMLGKKLPDHTAPGDCCPSETQKTPGSIISFSGRSQIRPASSLMSERYYSDTSQYLKSRGNTYTVNQVMAKIPGIVYYEGTNVVWPQQEQIVNGKHVDSSMFENCTTATGKCVRTTTIYKPSNSKYANQGAVTAGERLLRLKTENPVVRTTITGKKL